MNGTLDVDDEELSQALGQVHAIAEAYFRTGGDGPVVPPPVDRLLLGLDDPLPEAGIGLSAIVGRIGGELLPRTTRTASPSFMGLITTGGNPYSLSADMIATSLNQHVTRGQVSPLASALEAQVIRWIGEFIGFPAASGSLTSGGSLANMTALGAARAARFGQQSPPRDLVVYASDQSHFSVQRACDVLGLGPRGLNLIASSSDFTIDLEALEQAIARDRREGREPFAIVANAGTVFTGAIDDLTALADLCERASLWLHVDAAYGGPAAGTDIARSNFVGLDRADSVAIDAHKWFFVPYEAGCVLVREGSALSEAYGYTASYTAPSGDQAVDFMDLGLQMSRDFKALKIWALFAGAGAAAIRRAIESNIQLMKSFAAELCADDRFELLAPVPLSIVCFRPRGLSNPQRDCQTIASELQRRGAVFITTVDLKGEAALRACSVNHRAKPSHTALLRDELVEVARALSPGIF